MEITIKRVISNRDLVRFIRFPHKLYAGNAYWCPALGFDEKNTLKKDKNPAFEFCESEYWLAYQERELVGRVAGIINYKANKRWNENLVRFGWIDFIEDIRVAEKLIETVTIWGKEKGMTGIQGPLGFSDLDNEGMLIRGFEEKPTLSSIYNYPYYPEYMIKMGFEKGVDWLQFEIPIPDKIPDKVERTASLVERKFNLRYLQVRKRKELLPFARKMFVMLNHAFDILYGYSQLNEKQIEAYIRQYFGFIRPEFVSIILDPKDEVIGFGITMPSLTRAFQKSRGRLFPLGFLHIYKAIKKNNFVDMYLVGVRPDYQGKGVLGMVYYQLHKAYIEHHILKAVTNPQLEENFKAVSIWKNYDARQHITRRCWIKRFDGN